MLKIKRKLTAAVLAEFFVLTGCIVNTYAEDVTYSGIYHVVINGSVLGSSYGKYYNIDGKEYYQLRDIANVLGYKIEWDDDTGTAFINQSDKLFPFMVEESYLYGYMDINGKTVIEPQYAYAGEFVDDLAVTADADTKLRGYINPYGETVIDHIYFDAGDFNDGIAYVSISDPEKEIPETAFYIDKSGKKALECEFEPGNQGYFSCGYAYVLTEGGLYPVPPGYESDNKWGYIRKDGSYVEGVSFDTATTFSDGYALVQKDGKWGFINTDFETVLDFIYDDRESAKHAFSTYTLYYRDFKISMNNKDVLLEDPVVVLNDCIYLSAKDVGKALDLKVYWDKEHEWLCMAG